MTPLRWVILALALAGLAFPWCLLAAIVLYEFGVRRGKDAVAVWLEGRFGGGRGGRGGYH